MRELNQIEGVSLITHSRFAGLITSESPNSRALPPGPNAAAPNYAINWENWIVNKDTGLLESRPGVQDLKKTNISNSVFSVGSTIFTNKHGTFLIYLEKSTNFPNTRVFKVLKLVKSNSIFNSGDLRFKDNPVGGVYNTINWDTKTLYYSQDSSVDLRVNTTFTNLQTALPTSSGLTNVNLQFIGESNPITYKIKDNLSTLNLSLFINNTPYFFQEMPDIYTVVTNPVPININPSFSEINGILYILIGNSFFAFNGLSMYNAYIQPSHVLGDCVPITDMYKSTDILMVGTAEFEDYNAVTDTQFGDREMISSSNLNDNINYPTIYIDPSICDNTHFEYETTTNSRVLIEKPKHFDQALVDNPTHTVGASKCAFSLIRAVDLKQSDVSASDYSSQNYSPEIEGTPPYPLNPPVYTGGSVYSIDTTWMSSVPFESGVGRGVSPWLSKYTPIIKTPRDYNSRVFSGTGQKFGQHWIYRSLDEDRSPLGVEYNTSDFTLSGLSSTNDYLFIEHKDYFFKCYLKIDYIKYTASIVPVVHNVPVDSELVPILIRGKFHSSGSSSLTLNQQAGFEVLRLPFTGQPYTGEWESHTALRDIIPFRKYKTGSGETYSQNLSIVYDTSSLNGVSTHAAKIYTSFATFETDGEGVEYITKYSDIGDCFLADIIPLQTDETGTGPKKLYSEFLSMVPPENKGPSAIMDQQIYSINALKNIEGEVGPIGTCMTTFKNRIYMGGIVDNPQMVYSTNPAYSPEQPEVGWPTSFNIDSDRAVTNLIGEGNSLSIFTDTSAFLLSGDFPSNTTRLDRISDRLYGCVGPNASIAVEGDIYWLSPTEGLLKMNANSYQITHLGPSPRILTYLLDNNASIDLKDTIARYLPTVNYVTWSNKSWDFVLAVCVHTGHVQTFSKEFDSSNGGGVIFLDDGSYVDIICTRKGDDELIRSIKNSNTLLDYADSHLTPSSGLVDAPIKLKYSSDYFGSIMPELQKKLTRISLESNYIQQLSQNIRIINEDDSIYLDLKEGDFTIKTSITADLREDLTHSASRLKLSKKVLNAVMKLRPSKALTYSYTLEHEKLYTNPKIQSITLEFAPTYKRKSAKWIRGRR